MKHIMNTFVYFNKYKINKKKIQNLQALEQKRFELVNKKETLLNITWTKHSKKLKIYKKIRGNIINNNAKLYTSQSRGISFDWLDLSKIEHKLLICPKKDLPLYVNSLNSKEAINLYKQRLEGLPPIKKDNNWIKKYEFYEKRAQRLYMIIEIITNIIIDYISKNDPSKNNKYIDKIIELHINNRRYTVIRKNFQYKLIDKPENIKQIIKL